MKTALHFLLLFIAGAAFSPVQADGLDLKPYRNQIVYVDFWASWCLPCKKSFPWMNEMHRKYKDQGLKIIAINVDEDSADANRFLTSTPAEFTILHDPEGKLAEHYKITGMPTSLLFDANGKLVGRHAGFKKSKTANYEAELKALLATIPK